MRPTFQNSLRISTATELLCLWLFIIPLNVKQPTSLPAVNTCTRMYPGPLKWLIARADMEHASLAMRFVKCTYPLHPRALSFQSQTHIALARLPSGISGNPHGPTRRWVVNDWGRGPLKLCHSAQTHEALASTDHPRHRARGRGAEDALSVACREVALAGDRALKEVARRL